MTQLTNWQIAKVESWHWGVVIYNQIVTWTAFAILAMFSNSPSKPILPPRYSDLLLTTHLLSQDLFSFDISSDIFCSAFSQLHLLNPYFFPSRPLDPDILPILTFTYISGNSSWTQFISMFQGTSRSRSAQRIQGLSVWNTSLGSLWELRQFPGNGLFTGFDVNTSRNAEKDKRGSTRKAALPSRGKGVVGQRATGNCSF